MKSNIFKWFLGFFAIGICFLAVLRCTSVENNSPADPAYVAEIQEWHNQRIKSLKKKNGWLTLAGLFWLKEGENTFGSDSSNDMVFPAKAPAVIGTITLKDSSATIDIKSGIQVFHDGKPVHSQLLKSDASGDPTILTLGSLSWYLIKRGDKFGVRLKDSEHPNLQAFTGVEMYPINPRWRVKARLEPYDPPKSIAIPTVLGTVLELPCPGALVFEIDGKTLRLEPVAEPGDDELWLIFGDATNGEETYGAGRFLYVDKPGDDGTTFIDFNKAYNPPCAFTAFATCPLPPAQNRLPVKVTAGEKNYHGPVIRRIDDRLLTMI